MKFYILSLITLIFLAAGTFIPFINSEYQMEDSDDYSLSTSEIEEADSVLSLGSVTFSIISMFFWSFGVLPFWLEMIFLFFRVVFWFIIIDILIPG